MLKTNTIVLEGPDLAGKTTLYNSIHKETGYKWNIQDRSFLSMVCFARQFGRDDTHLRVGLNQELLNLNNRLVVLLPSFNVLAKRFKKRGDEIQSLASLEKLYEIFYDEVQKIKHFPNVLIMHDIDVPIEDNVKSVVSFVGNLDDTNPLCAGELIKSLLCNGPDNELTVRANFHGNIAEPDDSILCDPHEGDYYKNILWDFENTIRKELRGLNPYNKPQDMSSRRFYYTSDSCISSIHLMPRGENLKCFATFRSTNAVINSGIDLEFVHYLVHRLGCKYFYNCKKFDMSVIMNSAHLVV